MCKCQFSGLLKSHNNNIYVEKEKPGLKKISHEKHRGELERAWVLGLASGAGFVASLVLLSKDE